MNATCIDELNNRSSVEIRHSPNARRVEQCEESCRSEEDCRVTGERQLLVLKSVERLSEVSTGMQCDLPKKFPTTENELASAILTKVYEQLIMEKTD